MIMVGNCLNQNSKSIHSNNQSLDITKKSTTTIGSEEESFEPQYYQIKKLGLKVNKNKLKTGGWSSQENQIYLAFMTQNAHDFQSQKSRRKTKVFYRISKILKKRTPDQCRSHHQKLQIKHKNDLNAIMKEVQRKIVKGQTEQRVKVQKSLSSKTKQDNKQQIKTILKMNWFVYEQIKDQILLTVDINRLQSQGFLN